MKKHGLLLAACAMLLVFGACGNGGQKQENKEDKTEATMVTTSPDLVFFDLQGPVKRCELENDYYLFPASSVEFDRSGLITTADGYDPFLLKEPNYASDEIEYVWSRNEQGQISSIMSEWSGSEYVWENGRISPTITGVHEDLLTKCEMEYDAQGHVAKQTLYDAPDSDEEIIDWELNRVEEFTYLDFDDHGNWTRCKVKYHDYEIDLDGEEEIVRKIEYY